MSPKVVFELDDDITPDEPERWLAMWLWYYEDHLEWRAEEALDRLDVLVAEQKERFDFEWLVTMLERKIPPGPTGWFYYEYKIAERFAKQVGLHHMLDRAIQRISPQGAGIALRVH